MEISDKHKTVAWRGGMGTAVAILAFLGIYVFNTVTAIPETYPTKEEVDRRMTRGIGFVQEKQDIMNDAVRRDLDQIIQMQKHTQESVDQINKYLLNHQ